MNGQQLFTNFQAIITSMSHADLVVKYGTADLNEIFKRGPKGNFTNPVIRNEWKLVSNCVFGAFSSDWKKEGKEDPHGNYYENSTRGELALGHLTDDQMANLAYLESDVFRHRNDPVRNGHNIMPIVIATGVKERLRWLSRRATALEDQLISLDIEPIVTAK